MKKVWRVVTLTTLFALAYNIAPHMGASTEVMLAAFIFSPFLVLYMAWVILKFGTPSSFTFEERFYDDHPYQRNGKEELE